MVFHRNKKKEKMLRIFWTVIGILVIISMVLLYAPIFGPPSQSGTPSVPTHGGQ